MTVQVEKPTNPRFQDLEDQSFDRWTVIAYAGVNEFEQSLWLCRCECGTERVVAGSRLTTGRSRSCGCLRAESITTHGSSYTPEYQAWAAMIHRCSNSANEHFLDYGGRGVTVCTGWLLSFATFLSDVGLKPSRKHSLDRIDNDGHYSCGHCEECLENCWTMNCRWATVKEQNRNKRSNRLITCNGETKTLIEWAECRGMRVDTLWRRLNRLRWSVEDALFRPVRAAK